MALETSITDEAASGSADAVARLLDSGYLRAYSGTPPANAGTALSGNTLIAEWRLSATSAPASSGGIATFTTIAPAPTVAAGTISFVRAFKANGTSAILQGSVGVASAATNVTMSNTSVTSGLSLTPGTVTYNARKATTGY